MTPERKEGGERTLEHARKRRLAATVAVAVAGALAAYFLIALVLKVVVEFLPVAIALLALLAGGALLFLRRSR